MRLQTHQMEQELAFSLLFGLILLMQLVSEPLPTLQANSHRPLRASTMHASSYFFLIREFLFQSFSRSPDSSYSSLPLSSGLEYRQRQTECTLCH